MSIPYERIIRAVTKEKIRNYESFTSVDIANTIKKFGLWIRNQTVAKRLNQCVLRWAEEEGKVYKTDIIKVDAGIQGMVNATIYIPDNGINSEDYLNRDQKAYSQDDFNNMHKTKVMPWNSNKNRKNLYS